MLRRKGGHPTIVRKRDPNLLTHYSCFRCGEQVRWGELVRILCTDPEQEDWRQWELYAHRACLRSVLRAEVPFAMGRHWTSGEPLPDDSDQIDGQPCGFCAGEIGPESLTRLRLQNPVGTERAPAFDEESVPVHTACLRAASHSKT